MSRTALAAVSQTPTGANAHRLIVVTRYTTKSTGCYVTIPIQHSFTARCQATSRVFDTHLKRSTHFHLDTKIHLGTKNPR
ncbi:hypothetical protein RB11122 [Rhodopirellula baltica SH 1]|uniref:Uncharacterized protein n=1 Tax=Rhodopirellula baltica (strain DSM 10527 / NCIMB 13988 / SH1) TaxID=243090 RepID=Q7UJQ9_RHOBA|nr:hypothetical protein RB11122 [Rhodopirellula baltica SH 1]